MTKKMKRAEFIRNFMIGGVAAAVAAAKRGCTPRELPYGELRRQLVANGGYI